MAAAIAAPEDLQLRQAWRAAECDTARVAQPDRTRSFTAALLAMPGGKARVSVPFDPNQAWGTKSLHHVNGTVAGIRVRVTVTEDA